jgi:hypothetical protein
LLATVGACGDVDRSKLPDGGSPVADAGKVDGGSVTRADGGPRPRSDGAPPADAAADGGVSCETSADCGEGGTCAFAPAAACGSRGTCFTGVVQVGCSKDSAACACDGSAATVPSCVSGLPDGYTVTAIAHLGACGSDGGAASGVAMTGETCTVSATGACEIIESSASEGVACVGVVGGAGSTCPTAGLVGCCTTARGPNVVESCFYSAAQAGSTMATCDAMGGTFSTTE